MLQDCGFTKRYKIVQFNDEKLKKLWMLGSLVAHSFNSFVCKLSVECFLLLLLFWHIFSKLNYPTINLKKKFKV